MAGDRLAEAKGRAGDLAADVRKGRDPIHDQRQEALVETFEALSERYMREHEARNARAGRKSASTIEAQRQLNRNILPVIGAMRIEAVTRQHVRLVGEPDLWCPLYPELWKAPLPEAVTLMESGRMVSERLRFTAVEDAEAADLAREMEADRESARAAGDTAKGRRVDVQWWRDATEIVYERPPNITLRMVEARLMRAVACCSDPKRACDLHISPLLAQISEAAAQALAEIEATSLARHHPTLQAAPGRQRRFPHRHGVVHLALSA